MKVTVKHYNSAASPVSPADGEMLAAICGKSNVLSTADIQLVTCKNCLKAMQKASISANPERTAANNSQVDTSTSTDSQLSNVSDFKACDLSLLDSIIDLHDSNLAAADISQCKLEASDTQTDLTLNAVKTVPLSQVISQATTNYLAAKTPDLVMPTPIELKLCVSCKQMLPKRDLDNTGSFYLCKDIKACEARKLSRPVVDLKAKAAQLTALAALPKAQRTAAIKSTAPKKIGIKQQIRALLESGTAATAQQFLEMTQAATLSNVVTAISDLKSPKYCGEGAPLAIISTTVEGVKVYSL